MTEDNHEESQVRTADILAGIQRQVPLGYRMLFEHNHFPCAFTALNTKTPSHDVGKATDYILKGSDDG